jgi:UDP-glucose 4-epimerase
MRILVTGSSGRVGRAIHIRLSATHEVAGLDRSPSSTVAHVGELDDPPLLRRALAGADAVVHCAALHAPHVGHLPDAEFQRINVDGTRRLLDAAAAAGVARFVFTSTTALYGRAAHASDHAAWVDENLEPQPLTIYHRSKLAAEALLREAAAQGGPSVRILRMSRCFPEPANVMALFRLHRGVDARDVAGAHELALAHPGAAHATFVVSGATPFLREDVEALGQDAPAVVARRCPALVAAFARRGWPLPRRIDRVYSAQHAADAFGWRPRFGFEEVLAQFDAESGEVLPPDPGLRWSPD